MLLFNVLLTVIWVLLTNELSFGNAIFGFVLSLLLIGLTERVLDLSLISVSGRRGYLRRFIKSLFLLLFFLRELLQASVQVVVSILSPHSRLRPGVIAIPLDLRTNTAITLLANFITLTPGTLTLDVSTDKKVIYVHSINVVDRESFISSIKEGFEARIKEVLE